MKMLKCFESTEALSYHSDVFSIEIFKAKSKFVNYANLLVRRPQVGFGLNSNRRGVDGCDCIVIISLVGKRSDDN